MNRNTIILLGCLIMASCTVNRYYIVGGGNETKDITQLVSETKKNTGTKGTKSIARISYDESLPEVPRASLISKSPVYNPQDKHTFPVYGNETAVVPPKNTTQEKTVAIWCTKECTVVAGLSQLQWDLHYFQQSSLSYIQDCHTGKKYYLTGSYNGCPVDTSYNIRGVSGEWISEFSVYPPLPKGCTEINIIEGPITDNVLNGPGWGGGLHLRNMPVSVLQANQAVYKFHKTRIIE